MTNYILLLILSLIAVGFGLILYKVKGQEVSIKSNHAESHREKSFGKHCLEMFTEDVIDDDIDDPYTDNDWNDTSYFENDFEEDDFFVL